LKKLTKFEVVPLAEVLRLATLLEDDTLSSIRLRLNRNKL
jgi:hypothetical protein